MFLAHFTHDAFHIAGITKETGILLEEDVATFQVDLFTGSREAEVDLVVDGEFFGVKRGEWEWVFVVAGDYSDGRCTAANIGF